MKVNVHVATDSLAVNLPIHQSDRLVGSAAFLALLSALEPGQLLCTVRLNPLIFMARNGALHS